MIDFYRKVMKLCQQLSPVISMEDKLVWLSHRLPHEYHDVLAKASKMLPKELE